MAIQAKRRPGAVQPPKIEYISIKGWDKGMYTRLDSDRTPQDALRVGENVKLEQNGTIGPRPGLKVYGIQPTGTVLGQVYEFVYINTAVTPNVPQNYNIRMEVRSGVGTVIVSKDGGTETIATGKTYSATAKAHFEQIYGKVLITNGVDTLSYMDIQTFTITSYTALTTPSAPTATQTGLATANLTLRYRVTAANQGETAGSTAGTVTVTKLRENWNGTSEYVTVTGAVPTNATRMNIYVGDTAGSEYYLDTISVTSGGTYSYVDTGAIAVTITRVAPAGDSTAGPKVTRATNIKGQVYMVGDNDNQGRIWFGGTIGTSALDFSSFNGGGWVEPNKGGKDFPVVVKPFRDGKGTPMAVCVSKGTNGAGKRYLLQPSSTTLGTTLITYMAVQEDNGADGTDSPDGVVFTEDALWYPSSNGFKTTSTRPQIQNILSTQGISDNISTDVLNLSSATMDACVGLAYDRRIYWALPSSSSTNNQIWVLDLREKGAWMRPWYVAADWIWLYADNTTGKTKMLALVNNGIYEIDQSTTTNDNGTAFSTTIGSGDIKFSDDGSIWGTVIDFTFIFLRPQGNINLSVNVNTEDGLVPFTDTLPGGAKQAVGAWGRNGWGRSGWGDITPSLLTESSSVPRKAWTIPIDEEVNSISFGVGSTDAGVYYQLAEIIIRYVNIGFKELDN